ncbi:hypothetical protein HELRODRAFT_170441 [Helobdella robusta]|uniref:Telomeric repeat-binding factor 2-interacting protein 1 n=1 Tax=Helobdella robusta TaxID=6412 RepID=T1F327_HELRO|nr:hypothetical protein HELRODRAFT_170441 [Helobdella robusta]ESO07139.1 hypothetical protein HELRODRAFT_170441 [Helobdella robusta]
MASSHFTSSWIQLRKTFIFVKNLYKNFPLSRNKFSSSEDVAILNYVLKDNKYVNAGGNIIWQKAEELKITDHPWQSMKDRFRRYILNNLNSYHTVERELRILLAKHFSISVKIEKPPKPLYFLPGNSGKSCSTKQSIEASSDAEKKSDSRRQSSKNNETTCHIKYIDYDGNPPCSSKSMNRID